MPGFVPAVAPSAASDRRRLRQVEGGGQDWRRRRAGVLILEGEGGRVGFGRVQDEDGLRWIECQVAQPGKLGRPVAGGAHLTPDELIEALRGPLGLG